MSREPLPPRPNNIPIDVAIAECLAMNRELFKRLAEKRGIAVDEGHRDIGGGSGGSGGIGEGAGI